MVYFKGEFYAEYVCQIFHIKINGSGGIIEVADLHIPYIMYDFLCENKESSTLNNHIKI